MRDYLSARAYDFLESLRHKIMDEKKYKWKSNAEWKYLLRSSAKGVWALAHVPSQSDFDEMDDVLSCSFPLDWSEVSDPNAETVWLPYIDLRSTVSKDPSSRSPFSRHDRIVGRLDSSTSEARNVQLQDQNTNQPCIAETVASWTKIAMNYNNYIKAIMEGKNLGLLGWLRDVDFKQMSKQSAISPFHTLHDALKTRTCRWAVLSANQKKQLLAEFKEMVDDGKVTEKAAKPQGKGKSTQPASDDNDKEGAVEEEEEEDTSQARETVWGGSIGGATPEAACPAPTVKAKSGKHKCLNDNDDNAPAAKKKSASARKCGHPADEENNAPAAKKQKASDPSRRTSRVGHGFFIKLD
ncbi:hypothetical protein DFH08DRAFT_813810 [Mycena albidolilacea]|uniref:Uncharacterized protein n=1 Tax=Mycena albidolilacea TaxID=1033008 RepID=A0AAD7EMD8_9AGAR|nr:hypothetical protein DFH08DRAFT_813810 [Mycena albidolilacea]